MSEFQIIIAAVTGIILFIFGLENFSREIQRIAGQAFRERLSRASGYPVVGVFIGAIVTALIQSSSATSVITISLVNAGVLSFENSIGIILGSNIGTTVTAQLVAFKLTHFAPIIIILGFLLSFMRSKISIFGKLFFYFGFVFFTLNMISEALSPLKEDPRIIAFLTEPHSIFLSVLVGMVITALVQSSSVTTGLAVIFVQQGLMSLDNAIPILMGANIGTTATAMLAIVNMDLAAKKTAMAHFFFNAGGVIIFLPIVGFWKGPLPLFSETPAIQLANFHIFFNIVTAIVFLILLKPFRRMIDKIFGEGRMDFERLEILKWHPDESLDDYVRESRVLLDKTLQFIGENYSLVVLSIETNIKGLCESAEKRLEYVEYLKVAALAEFSKNIGINTDISGQGKILKLFEEYEYLFQIHDSVKDIYSIKQMVSENYIELKFDLILMVRELSGKVLECFEETESISNTPDARRQRQVLKELQLALNHFNSELLKLVAQPDRKDAGALIQLMTYSQRLKDKLARFGKIRVRQEIPGQPNFVESNL